MPVNWALYPHGWQGFAATIKHQRAAGRCECTGECGLHQPNPTPRRCTELHGTPARWFRGRVTLTVAHLCNCDPLCMNPHHVKAMCQRCHLRVDRYKHARARLATQKTRHWTPARAPWHPGAMTSWRAPCNSAQPIPRPASGVQAHPPDPLRRRDSP